VPGATEVTRFEKIHNVCFENSLIASKMVAKEIADTIQSNPQKCVLGLATGSSPIQVYEELIRLHRNEGLSFKNVVSFNLDEYIGLPPNHPNSYNYFMNFHLFKHIDIQQKNIFIPSGKLSNTLEKDCLAYEKEIKDHGGIDFQLLGIGRTGHIGFNEPGSHVNSQTRLIHLDPITLEDAANDFNGLNHVPKKAITMGIQTILNARRIILLGWGDKKASIIAQTIEDSISDKYPASYLQKHQNCTIIMDEEASKELTKYRTPWLVQQCAWDNLLKKKAIIWLSEQVNKPILQLTTRDYNENGLSDLGNTKESVYDLNIWMFNQLQSTITGWPGGKPTDDLKKRPERAQPAEKKCLIFSPHPDDDVISMGGTLSRLIDQKHDVHVAYQTSGNIAVSDDEAIKFIEVAQKAICKSPELKKQLTYFKNNIFSEKTNPVEKKRIREIKGAIRRSECYAAARFLNLTDDQLHFLDLPFYETGEIMKNKPTEVDIKITMDLIMSIKPHQIFAAGDLADPHGTHKTCLDILLMALKNLKDEPFMENCWLWLYRGAWQEWPIEEIEMAIPLSPDQVIQKRNAILFHQSQKDKVMFQGEDKREFWVRAEQRNQKTAEKYNLLGLAEYKAIEAFKRHPI